MYKIKHKEPLHRVYTLEGSRYWWIIANIVFIVLIFLFFVRVKAQDDPALMWFLVIILVPMYGYLIFRMFIQAKETSITFHDDGLEYRLGNSRLFVEWDDISHLGWEKQGRYKSYGIFLKEEIQPEVEGIIDTYLFGKPRNFIRLDDIIDVPTHWDFWKGSVVKIREFAKTELGYDLKQYVPHLFEKEKAKV